MDTCNAQIHELYNFYREYLLSDVIAFWEDRTIDLEFGGFITGFDRTGNIIDESKNTWMQGRQVWMFSTLYEKVENREKWLRLARHGRNFLAERAYAGNGQWNYILGRNGSVIQGPVSVFGDLFALEGLSAYCLASGDRRDLKLIEETLEAVTIELEQAAFHRIAPQKRFEGTEIQGVYMIALNSLEPVERLLGDGRAKKLRCLCLEKIMTRFSNPKAGLMFDILSGEGTKVPGSGILVNPGHTFESMWFCLEAAMQLGMEEYIQPAVKIIEGTLRISKDSQYGGIFYMLTPDGGKPDFWDWITERNLKYDEKVWWTHAEALYSLLLASEVGKRPELFSEFLSLQNWCFSNFADKEYGEWYYVLNRNGIPRLDIKGGLQKCAFHLPRALYKIMILLKKISEGNYKL